MNSLTPSESMRDLSRRLLDAAHPRGSSPSEGMDAARVCQIIKVSLSRFTGDDAVAALMRRAVVLASAEFPALKNMNFNSDCISDDQERLDAEAAVALTAHLLGLMVTFIGEALTLNLLRQAWPGVFVNEQADLEKGTRQTS